LTTWFEKHAPKSLSEVAGQETRKLLSFASGKTVGKALLIFGPTGTGKTCSVHALASDLGCELIEVNASSACDAGTMKSVVGNAAVNRGLFGERLILVDDVDSLTASDRGGITELINIIKKSRTPIIITATDPWDPKLRTLRSYCEFVEFKKVNLMSIRRVIASICNKENVTISTQAINVIATRAEGDLRAAINDLEMLAGDSRVSDYELDVMGFRDKTASIFQGLQKLFNGAKFDEVFTRLMRLT
jgi:replication factor C large subunit